MIKRIIKWHKRRQRAMRIGMRWIETEEKIISAVGSLKLFSRGFAKGGFVGKSPSGGYISPLKEPGELIMPIGTSFRKFDRDIKDSISYAMGIPRHMLTDKPTREPQIVVDSRSWTGRP